MDFEALFLKVRNGDEVAESMILSQFSPLIEKICAPFFVKGGEKEDILQVAKCALFEAIKGFDSSRNVSFEAFARVCIRNRVISEIRGSLRKKHMPLNQYVSISGLDEDGEWAQVSSPEEAVLYSEDVANFFEATKRALSEFEQDVLNSYLYYESYDAVAQALKVSKKSVDNAMCRIRKKLGSKKEGMQ